MESADLSKDRGGRDGLYNLHSSSVCRYERERKHEWKVGHVALAINASLPCVFDYWQAIRFILWSYMFLLDIDLKFGPLFLVKYKK